MPSEKLLNTLNMKKHLQAALLLCLATAAQAQTFESGGVTYTVTDATAKTVQVGTNTNCKVADLTIPATVNYEGNSYAVTSVKDNAFANNATLRSITLPASVTFIDNQAFLRCKALTSASYPGVKKIARFAFYECTALQSAVIPESCKVLERQIWDGCGLLSVVIPASLDSIGDGMFQYCDTLSSVTLKPGLKKLGTNMFAYCSNLSSIDIPVGIDTIPDWCFAWSGLTQINLPNTLRHIGDIAFCNIIAPSITIPEGVVSIGANSFSQNTALTSVTLPSTLRHIGEYAFALSPFTTIVLPEGLETIGQCAFISCTKLTTLNIPGSVKKIPYELCHNDSKLVNLTINEGTTSLGTAAFHGLRNLKSFTIPSTVTEIVGNPISYTGVRDDKLVCKSPHFIVENGILYSKDRSRLISYNSSATTFSVPSGTQEISAYAFADAVGQTLTDVTLPEGVTTLGTAAFGWCPRLKSINLPSSITKLEEQVFDFCSVLPSIHIPEGITEIKRETFYYCKALTDVKLPESLKVLGQNAFGYCQKLDSIALPANLNKIGQRAFAGCNKLMAVTCLGSEPAAITGAATTVFVANTLNKGNLHVPASAVETYKNANGWKSFAHIIGDVNGVISIDNDNEPCWTVNGNMVEFAQDIPYAVYSLDGRCCANGSDLAKRTVELPSGIYILCAGNKSGKIVVR